MSRLSKYLSLLVIILLGGMIFASGCLSEPDDYMLREIIKPVIIFKNTEQWCESDLETCGNRTVYYEIIGKVPPENRPEWNNSFIDGILGKAQEMPEPTVEPAVNQSYVVIETLPPTTIATPNPTPTIQPTLIGGFVDPYAGGDRWEGQWFRWSKANVSGLQSLDRGVVVYGHYWLDGFTYWDDAWGNYFSNKAPGGYRYLAVLVHQEEFDEDNSGLWGYGNSSFWLQYNQQLHQPYYGHNYVYAIRELETIHANYYADSFIKPYGIERQYVGLNARETGGYTTYDKYSLWYGPGNAWDGYILYLVPAYLGDYDIRIVGNFAGTPVNWRFDSGDVQRKYALTKYDQNGRPLPVVVPTVTREVVRV